MAVPHEFDDRLSVASMWVLLTILFTLFTVVLLGLILWLHQKGRRGPRRVCFIMFLSLLLRSVYLLYYLMHADASPAMQLVSRINLCLTFTAVSFLLTLWVNALTPDKDSKARVKKLHRAYNAVLYGLSLGLEVIAIAAKSLGLQVAAAVMSGLLGSLYVVGALAHGWYVSSSRGNFEAHLYRHISPLLYKLQVFSVTMGLVYLLFVVLLLAAVFLGTSHRASDYSFYAAFEAALATELVLACLIIAGVSQPFIRGGRGSGSGRDPLLSPGDLDDAPGAEVIEIEEVYDAQARSAVR